MDLKKEKYVLRFYRKNVVLSNIVDLSLCLIIITVPLVTFLMGSHYQAVINEFGYFSNEESLYGILLVVLILLPFLLAMVAVKYVYPDIYKVESTHREDIIFDLAVNRMKETFAKFLEKHAQVMTIELPDLQPEKD